MRCQQFVRAAHLLTNLHFVLRKVSERGVAELRRDLEDACLAFKAILTKGGIRLPSLSDIPTEELIFLSDRLIEYHAFILKFDSSLSGKPNAVWELGLAQPEGSIIGSDARAAIEGFYATVDEINEVSAPSATVDEINEVSEPTPASLSEQVAGDGRNETPVAGWEEGREEEPAFAGSVALEEELLESDRGAWRKKKSSRQGSVALEEELLESDRVPRVLAALERLRVLQEHGVMSAAGGGASRLAREARALAATFLRRVKSAALAFPEGKESLGESVMEAHGAGEDGGTHWEKEDVMLHIYALLQGDLAKVEGAEGHAEEEEEEEEEEGGYEPKQALATLQVAPLGLFGQARSRPGSGASGQFLPRYKRGEG
ncbi:hypothetical protein T484DRAFT_1791912 [Baffinella frigidus]|nr:hypothetical protein T484DRAFT_1791912 [Cryptophyta sp. CCMP2293]